MIVQCQLNILPPTCDKQDIHTPTSHHKKTHRRLLTVKDYLLSRIYLINAVLASAPKATTNKLQRVLNAAARVVSSTHKFNRGLSRLLHTELHRLDFPERVVYKLGIMVFNCLHG